MMINRIFFDNIEAPAAVTNTIQLINIKKI